MNRTELETYIEECYSIREEPGIFPGHHMNKAHWRTVALDANIPYSMEPGASIQSSEEVPELCAAYPAGPDPH